MKAFREECAKENSELDEKLRLLGTISEDEFINFCIMGGCEYIESIERVGLKVVLRNLSKFGSCEESVRQL